MQSTLRPKLKNVTRNEEYNIEGDHISEAELLAIIKKDSTRILNNYSYENFIVCDTPERTAIGLTYEGNLISIASRHNYADAIKIMFESLSKETLIENREELWWTDILGSATQEGNRPLAKYIIDLLHNPAPLTTLYYK